METQIEIPKKNEEGINFRQFFFGEGLFVWLEELDYGERRLFFEYCETLCGPFFDNIESIQDFSDSLDFVGLNVDRKRDLRELFRHIMSFVRRR